MIQNTINHPTVKQFTKFVLVGFVNTGVDWLTFFSLTQWAPWFHAHIIVANTISFIFGFTSSYTFNRRWTFRSKDPNVRRQLIIFLLVNLVGLLLSTTIVKIVYSQTSSRLISKTLAVAITLFWNFFAGRQWAFKPSKEV